MHSIDSILSELESCDPNGPLCELFSELWADVVFSHYMKDLQAFMEYREELLAQ